MAKVIKFAICLSMCLISILTEACASVNIETNTLRSVETDTLGSCIVSLTLERPYHIQAINDDDGKALIISFPDKASIILTDGNLFEFPPDKYMPEYIRYKGKRFIRGGTINKHSWRIDKFKSIKIYYLNVLENNKLKYDTILNNIQIKPTER